MANWMCGEWNAGLVKGNYGNTIFILKKEMLIAEYGSVHVYSQYTRD